MSTLLTFTLKAVSDLAFLPALRIMISHKRHFEFYVGFMQVFSAFMYNSVDVLGLDLYLEKAQWHFMSDVFSITYICVLSLHYMQLRQPDQATALRYVAFTLAWISKAKDGFYRALARHHADFGELRALHRERSLNRRKAGVLYRHVALQVHPDKLPKRCDGSGESPGAKQLLAMMRDILAEADRLKNELLA